MSPKRTPARFTEPGKRAAGIDLNSPQVNQFIALLKEHHTVIDPTIAIWENMYTDRPGAVRKTDAYMFDRLPLQIQRNSKTAGGALPIPDAATISSIALPTLISCAWSRSCMTTASQLWPAPTRARDTRCIANWKSTIRPESPRPKYCAWLL